MNELIFEKYYKIGFNSKIIFRNYMNADSKICTHCPSLLFNIR